MNNDKNDDEEQLLDYEALISDPKSGKEPLGKEAAASIARKKIINAHKEPSAADEAIDLVELGEGIKRTRHQQFLYDLTVSGKSISEIQSAWHEYYAGLTDQDKRQVWDEFYQTQAKSAKYITGTPTSSPQTSDQPILKKSPPKETVPRSGTVAELKDSLLGNVTSKQKLKPAQHLQSLLFGLGIGAIVLLIMMFSFFNERFIAPFIQPSRTVTSTPIINGSGNVGPNPEIIIPKINVEIPVIYDLSTNNEAAIQKALEGGVVHYADTAMPGSDGNVVIVGHSSNNIFNKGKYKFAFVLLSRLEVGDTFYLNKDGKRYTYQVYKKKIVKPTDVGVLSATDKTAVATLITCDPPGTSTNRLIVVGEQISPDPVANAPQSGTQKFTTQPAIIPGNSPSLWTRIKSSL